MQMIDVLKRLRELDAQNPNIVKENQNQLVPGKFYVVGSEDSWGGNPEAVAGPFDDEGEAEYEKAEYSQGGREGVAVAQWTGKDWNFDYMMEPQKEGIMDKIKGAIGGETAEQKQARLKAEFEKRKAQRGANQQSGTPERDRSEYSANVALDPKKEDLSECGMMGGMGQSHSPASISMSADSGSELSTMLKDIMTLAGMQQHHDHGADVAMPMGGADGVAVVDVEPMSGPGMDVDEPSIMRSMLDKLNPDMDDDEEVKEYGNTPNEQVAGYDAAVPSGNDLHKEKQQFPATQRGDNPMAATFESLMKEYRKFMSESSEEGVEEDSTRGAEWKQTSLSLSDAKAKYGNDNAKIEGKNRLGEPIVVVRTKEQSVEEGQLDELSRETVRAYADAKQRELDDVPPMPFKKPPRSKDEIERDAKGMMGALARLGGKKPTSGDVREEMSGEDIVYVSKTKVEDFKDWMESEGFDVPKPIEWTDTHAVFDFRDASNYAKMYADEWNEKRHDDDEDMYENINDILKLSGLK